MGIDDEDFLKIVKEIEVEEKKLVSHPLFQVCYLLSLWKCLKKTFLYVDHLYCCLKSKTGRYLQNIHYKFTYVWIENHRNYCVQVLLVSCDDHKWDVPCLQMW